VGSSQVRIAETAAVAASARAPAAWSAGLLPWASTISWSMNSGVTATPAGGLEGGSAHRAAGGVGQRTRKVRLTKIDFMAERN